MASTFETKGRPSRQDALDYHSSGRKGKIEIVATKPVATSRDLSLAYSPGVAEPCLEIAQDPDLSYQYTARGNLVAVISNGTAVLGLGDIGAYASKPVMEGKAVLFKKFADIDVFDVEVDARDIDTFCKVVKALEPTFGGVNLEDVKSPECFIIERRLRSEMQIPVFHDDQHGTAIITGAALINALELTGKRLADVKVVFVGAGAAAVTCAEQYVKLGVPREHIFICDKFGLVYRGRPEDMDEWKGVFAQGSEPRALTEVIRGADVVVGLSAKGVFSNGRVASLAPDAILFALANPVPEILPEEAQSVRSDIIMATGRSDYPNQVNNVLGFPGIFRGALDVRAKAINDEMKLAASRALAELARQDVPESVSAAYGGQVFSFGRDYIIPKPFDPRVLIAVAPAVAQAAIDSGVARVKVDRATYAETLRRRQGRTYEVMSVVVSRARRRMTRIAFPEGNHPRILRADPDVSGGDPAVAGDRTHPAGPARLGHVHRRVQGVAEAVRGLHGQRGSDGGGIGGHRDLHCGAGAGVRADAADRDAVVFELRHRSGRLAGEGAAGGGAGAGPPPGPGSRGRDAGGPGGGALGPRDGIPLRPPERGCERAHLPRSEQREHRLQAALAARRG